MQGKLGEKAPVEFWDAYKRCIDKYADFTGRASRSEFWKFSAVVYLLVSAIVFVFVLLGAFFDSSTVGAIGFVLASIVGLVHIVPSIAVAVRRLHDIGKSGWHILLTFIPIIGLIFLIIYEIKESQMVVNQYGPIPNLIFTEEEKAIAKKQTIIVLVLLIICSFW